MVSNKNVKKCIPIIALVCMISCQKKDDRWASAIKRKIEKSEQHLSTILLKTSAILNNNYDSKGIYEVSKTFKKNSAGAITNIDKTTKSNIFISKGVSLDSYIYKYLNRTDYLENYWESVDGIDDYVTWKYTYHVSSTIIRVYPWSNLSKMFGDTIEWNMLSYFKNISDIKKLKGKFCTYPYNDAGGTGVTVSCCSVFNRSNVFEDTIFSCADINFKKIIDDMYKSASEKGKVLQKVKIVSEGQQFHYKNNLVYDFSQKRIYQDGNSKNDKVLIESDFLNLKIYEIN